MSTTIETLKYTFSIANLKPRVISMNTPFCSNVEVETYNVETFSAMKYQCKQLILKLGEQYQGYTHRIYAWRVTSKLPEGTHEVGRLRFITTLNKTKQETHTNIELLPPTEDQDVTKPPKVKESTQPKTKETKETIAKPVRRFIEPLSDSESEDLF